MEQVRIDLVPGGVTPNAHASQYDVGRVIRFLLYNGGSAYTLAGTETITVKVEKPDGTTATVSVTNTSSNYVDFVTTDGLLDQAGLYPCEISLVNGSDVIGSQNFNLRAEADAYGTGLIVILEAQGSPAFFDTDLADNLVDCKIDIGYNAEGYTRATVVNSETSPAIEASPYLFRKAGGDLASIGAQEFDTITGGTVAFNQLVDYANITSETTSNVTFANNDGVITITTSGTASANVYKKICAPLPNTLGHKILFIGSATEIEGLSFYDDSSPRQFQGISTSTIINASGANISYYLRIINGSTVNTKISPLSIDLTQMFGATIADYIYSLETGTPGAGVAWFRNLFPAPYYAYNAGELLSVKTSAHKTTGKNLINIEELATTGITYANNELSGTGVSFNTAYGNGINSKTIIGNERLTISVKAYTDGEQGTSGNGLRIGFIYTDGTTSLIQFLNADTTETSKTLTSSSGRSVQDVFFSYGTNGNNTWHISELQLEFGSTATEFEPYQANTYALDPDLELRGMLKLDSGNHLYYDGDRYECDGHVTRRCGIVDLGSLSFTRWSNNNVDYIFYASIPLKENTKNNSGICPPFVMVNDNASGAANALGKLTTDNTCILSKGTSTPYIFIKCDTYTDATAFETAMDGVYLVYELATPTAETADAFTNPQNVDSYGTEEYTDTRTVPMPVGHSTIYGDDITYNIADFGTTVYGGSYDFTTGELISTKNADGTDKGTPDVYSLTPKYMPAREGDNYVMGNTDGDAYVKYMKKA